MSDEIAGAHVDKILVDVEKASDGFYGGDEYQARREELIDNLSWGIKQLELPEN